MEQAIAKIQGITAKGLSYFIYNIQKMIPHHSDPRLEIQLLDSEHCIITQFPIKLPDHLLVPHQIIPYPSAKGYSIHIKMLNSFKRFVEEFGVQIPSIPNIAFKMYRPLHFPRKQENWSTKPYQAKQMNSSDFYLFQHQLNFISFYLKSSRRLILGDDWNMGKTLTIIKCLQSANYKKVLIVTPSCFIAHWIHQLYRNRTENQVKWPIFTIDSLEAVEPSEGVYLISYEKLINLGGVWVQSSKIENFDNLVIDRPFSFLAMPNYQERLELLVLIASRVKGILVSQEVGRIEETKILIPLVNYKIKLPEVTQRYGAIEKELFHRIEFQKAMNLYYLYKNSRKQFRPPQIIKQLYFQFPTSPKINELTGEQGNLIGELRVQALVSYIPYILSLKKMKSIYLICIRQQTAHLLFLKLKQVSVGASVQFGEHLYIPQSNSGQPKIRICQLTQAVEEIQKNKKASGGEIWEYDSQHTMAIFCELYPPTHQQMVLEYTYKLFVVCEKIQYFVLVLNPLHPLVPQENAVIVSLNQIELQLIRPQIKINSTQIFFHEEPDIIDISNNSGQIVGQFLEHEDIQQQQKPQEQRPSPVSISEHKQTLKIVDESPSKIKNFQAEVEEIWKEGDGLSKQRKSRPKKSVQPMLAVRLIPRKSQLRNH